MITYSIELQHESGETSAQPLSAKSQTEAIRQLREWIREHPANDAQVYLAFDRTSDGQHGYINPDGASPTGRPLIEQDLKQFYRTQGEQATDIARLKDKTGLA